MSRKGSPYLREIGKTGVVLELGDERLNIAEARDYFWNLRSLQRMEHKRRLSSSVRVKLEADIDYREYHRDWVQLRSQLRRQGIRIKP